ncbi:MAG: UbiA family prenyltransferase [Chitinispirillaceae bacterium]|nr:UbiA family prenyltransferase [Chitinispirillaceae bacterium]
MSSHRRIGRMFDLLMVLRPVILIPVWGFCALGFRCAVREDAPVGIRTCLNSATIAVYGIILLFSLSVAVVYVMNQIADREVDRRNRGMPLVARGIVSVPSATAATGVCGFVSLFLLLLFHGHLFALAAATTLVLGFLYSFKPFRFSGRPFIDFISNAAGYGVIAFGVGWATAGKTVFCVPFLLNALPYFLLMCGGSISSTLPDIEGDRVHGKNTTAVVLGITRAHTLALLFIIAALIAGFFVTDFLAVLCAVASLPLYLLFYFKRSSLIMEATYKIGGSLCMIAAFSALPFFIPLALVVFAATWLYFRIRHGIAYPSLVPVTTGKM